MKTNTVPVLNFEQMPVKPATLKTLGTHLYTYGSQMGLEQRDYYSVLRSMLQGELSKKAARRTTMQELSRRAYNLDAIIVAGGAVSSSLVIA
jgi:hypothetical protein